MKSMKILAGFALALAAAALTACGGGGGGGSTPPPQSGCTNGANDPPTCTPAPDVTMKSITPANGATNVAANAAGSLAFDPGNGTLVANSANISATCGNTPVALNASVGATSPWTWTPVTAYSDGMLCSIVAKGDFKSAGGLTKHFEVTTTFTTKDTVGPTTTIASTQVGLNGPITFVASETLSAFSVTVNDGATAVSGTPRTTDQKTFNWTPTAAMACGKTLSIAGTATDTSNNTKPFTGTVTTAACTGLHYDVTLTVWDGGYPYKTTKTGRTAVVNQTSFAGTKPFISCGIPAADKMESDGRFQVKCTAIASNQRVTVLYNGETNAFENFTGTPLADDQFTLSENNSTQPVAGTTSAHSAAEGGWLYANPNGTTAEPTGRTQLLFQSDAGVTSQVEQGTFSTNGTIKVVRNYKR